MSIARPDNEGASETEAGACGAAEGKQVDTKSSRLRILPDEVSLRENTPFLKPLSWEDREAVDSPRALRSLSKIIDEGLCHRCGSCVGICPTEVLSLNDDAYPTVQKLSACTDCDLCVRVCPGDEFNFEEFREKSTSGGLVTALILHLMESGQADGAVVIASDDNDLWKGKPVIARTREEVFAATKSKYAISPTNSVFSEILEVPGRYVLVGLPCQIHGYLKAAQLDARLKERVVMTIGLFCHAAIEHEAFRVIWDSLGEKGDDAVRFISRLGKHPGSPHIELSDGSLYPVYFGHKNGYQPSSMEVINILYRLYTPQRCLTCFDALADYADISVGDPWMVPPEDDIDFYKGWSFGLLRTERAEIAVRDMIDGEKILSKDLTRKEALSCNVHMASEKRWRAFRVIEAQRRQGKPVPAYGSPEFRMPRLGWKQLLKTEGNITTHIFCFIPRLRKSMLKFFLGDGGYYLLWLNGKRRKAKYWARKTIAKWKRSLYGRG
jgi:coenzyme F420 hydrogenase subunit beta